MYFSKNSRYVLKKAHWIAPSSNFFNHLKTNDKNLSVKFPKEDPTKPPLRVNIPKDSSQQAESSHTKLLNDYSDSNQQDFKSKSIISRSQAAGNIIWEDAMLEKNQGDVFLSNKRDENYFMSTSNSVKEINGDKETPKDFSRHVTSGFENQLSSNLKNIKYENQSSVSLPLDTKTVQEVLTADYFHMASEDNEKVNKENNMVVKSKIEEKTSESDGETLKPKALCIIIDLPQSGEDESTDGIAVECLKELKQNSNFKDVSSGVKLFSKNQSVKMVKPLFDRHKSDTSFGATKEKSRIMRNQKGIKKSSRSVPKINFEVHEVEDAATYVFHVKLKKNFWSKPSAVKIVPEKELSLRNSEESQNDTLIRFSQPKSKLCSLTKEITTIEDPPESIRYSGSQYLRKKKTEKKDGLEDEKIASRRSKSHSDIKSMQHASKISKLGSEGTNETSLDSTKEEVKAASQQQNYFEDVNHSENYVYQNQNYLPGQAYSKSLPEQIVPKEKKIDIRQSCYNNVTHKSWDGDDKNATNYVTTTEESSKYDLSKENKPGIDATDQMNNNMLHQKVRSSREPRKYRCCENTLTEITVKKKKPSEVKGKISKKKLEEMKPIEKKTSKNALNWGDKIKRKTGKHTESQFHSDSKICHDSNSEMKCDKTDSDKMDFKAAVDVVTISSEKPYTTMNLCVAFPPVLSEALRNRVRSLGLRRDFIFSQHWTSTIDMRPKDFKINSKCMFMNSGKSEYEDNSIFFPKSKKDKLDCDSLFASKKDMILNVVKPILEESCPKMSDNMLNIVNDELTEEKGEASVDSLAMMKKVKEIINLDLNNAIKIFEGREQCTDQYISSVLVLDGNKWVVNNDELKQYIKIQEAKTKNEIDLATTIPECDSLTFENDKNEWTKSRNSEIPKYLPPKREIVMKLEEENLNSVISLHAENRELNNYEKVLRNSIQHNGEEVLKECSNQTFEGRNHFLNCETTSGSVCVYEMKSGDSILVFDEETQTWKVDFSILEKRKKQQKEEQELTKKSEFILETFEKFEQNQISTIPKPTSRERRIFDYKKEEWKDYKPDKKNDALNKSKTSKEKLPFKESDAEEIRKKNSDLYDNLFVSSKKDSKSETNSPGLESSSDKKEGKSYTGQKKEAKESGVTSNESTSSTTGKDPSTTKKDNEKPTPDIGISPSLSKEDDNYWESFLKMEITPQNILPKNIIPEKIIERPKIKMPGIGRTKTPESPKVKTPEAPKVKTPELPKIKTPEIPRVKTPELPRVKTPELPRVKTPEAPKVKTPENPKIKMPENLKIKIPDLPKVKTPVPPEIKGPSVPPATPSSIKHQQSEDPKSKPKVNKIEDSKLRIPLPFKGDKKIEKPKAKKTILPTSPSSKGKSKPEKPREKTPKSPPSVVGRKDSEIKTPPGTQTLKKDDPKFKNPPTIGAPKSEDSPSINTLKTPSSSSISSSNIKPSDDSKVKTSKVDGKKEKSASDHYISDNIVKISRTKKDKNSKTKSNKIETVKLNISTDKRMASKITEINLGKKGEEKVKKSTAGPKKQNSGDQKKSTEEKKNEKCTLDKKFYKNFEKYKTPFSDPDYEEKSVKINSDIESNPNLKKLDNWNKTLVLHDLVKPPENIESWLKDETDKMATLLLKVLQEAADGKPRRKPSPARSKFCEKLGAKGNPYDTIRKNQEANPENFLLKVRSVNIALTNGRKGKSSEDVKVGQKAEPLLAQSPQTPAPDFNAVKAFQKEPEKPTGSELSPNQFKSISDAFEAADPINASRELWQNPEMLKELTNEIPGPEALKKISNTWKMFPIISCQVTIFTLLRIFQLVNYGTSFFHAVNPEKARRNALDKLFTKYGPIVNIQGPLSGNVILIYKPEHLTGVFEQDASVPIRSVFDSLELSRRDTEEKLLPTGINTDWRKPEWNDLKKALNDPLMKGCEKFFGSMEVSGEALISNIRRHGNGHNHFSEDFMKEIKKWSMEGLCNILFEKYFNFLEGRRDNVNWILDPDKLYIAIEETTDFLFKCEKGFQAWRLMATPSFIGLGQSYRTLSTILSKQLYQAEINLKKKNEALKEGNLITCRDISFVESMLLNDGMTMDEITCNLVDILLIGINSMSSALGFLLYNLAQNTKVQNKLLKEVKGCLPKKNSRLDYHKLHSLNYLWACLKESLRLHMPIPVFLRVLQNDILLSNYIVPKGTYVVMDSKISCMRDKIFDDPEKFFPERWLSEEKWMQNLHPFASFPFCHGPRAELAKRVAEIQLVSSLARNWVPGFGIRRVERRCIFSNVSSAIPTAGIISDYLVTDTRYTGLPVTNCQDQIIRNFKIEYRFGEIQGTDSLISFPDKPLKLNFIERDE